MIQQIAVVAKKEIVDHAREVRALGASLMHLLMGPLVMLLIPLANGPKTDPKGVPMAAGMVIAIFALLAVFMSGMNVATDMVAGERERRSLLPLLLNPVSRLHLVIGKWLATSCFTLSGLAVSLGAFALLDRGGSTHALLSGPGIVCWVLLGLAPLGLLAAAVQIAISALCRTTKEAHTYLSILIFVPMGITMFMVFLPHRAGWAAWLPIIGQQTIAHNLIQRGSWSLPGAAGLALVTVGLAMAMVAGTGKLLGRDDIIYGS